MSRALWFRQVLHHWPKGFELGGGSWQVRLRTGSLKLAVSEAWRGAQAVSHCSGWAGQADHCTAPASQCWEIMLHE